MAKQNFTHYVKRDKPKKDQVYIKSLKTNHLKDKRNK